jgi:ribA/ribD-fused uncharacterized protein
MFYGDLAFLSNLDRTPFWMPELKETVRSGEHAFNALKTINIPAASRVLSAPTPAQAKAEGRRVPLRGGWDDGLRIWAMQRVLLAKFTVPELRDKLLATGHKELVETNTWHDNFWGDCRCGGSACEAPGRNMLGELLMALRARLAMREGRR